MRCRQTDGITKIQIHLISSFVCIRISIFEQTDDGRPTMHSLHLAFINVQKIQKYLFMSYPRRDTRHCKKKLLILFIFIDRFYIRRNEKKCDWKTLDDISHIHICRISIHFNAAHEYGIPYISLLRSLAQAFWVFYWFNRGMRLRRRKKAHSSSFDSHKYLTFENIRF